MNQFHLYTYSLTKDNDENLNKNKLIEYKREEQHQLKFNLFTKFTNKGDMYFMFEFGTSLVLPHQPSFRRQHQAHSLQGYILNPNKTFWI